MSAGLALPTLVADEHVVLRQLFERLESAGVRYCVLSPPERVGGKCGDVDVVVSPETLGTMDHLVARFCAETGGYLANVLDHETHARCYLCAWSSHGAPLVVLRLDVSGESRVDGRLLFRAEDLLTGRVRARDGSGDDAGYYTPAAGVAFAQTLGKRLLRGSIEPRHERQLASTWQGDPAGAEAWIARWWDERSRALIAAAADRGHWGVVRAALPRLRRELLRRLPARWRAARALARTALRRVMHPTGLVIAFLGPDGSGKTSVIERLLPSMAPLFRDSRYHHFKPNLAGLTLPPASTGQAKPYGKRPGWSAATLGKLGYYLFDYWVGYPLRVWPRIARSSLVIFDRYYHDLGIDPIRLKHAGVMKLAHGLRRAVPQAELYLLLEAPPEVVQSRKREVPAEETARQHAEFGLMVRGMPNGHVVDAGRPLREVITEVEDTILEHLADRTARRLGLEGATPRRGRGRR